MRIAFIVIGNSRRSNYLNGDTIRYGGGGGSGTDGSSIIVAEQLALLGHEVVIASEKLEHHLEITYSQKGINFDSGKVVRGVQYCNMDFEGVENKEFDILVSSLWFQSYNTLPIVVTRGLIYWCHMQWIYGIEEIIDYVNSNNLSLGFVNISEWERNMNQGVLNSVKTRLPSVKNTLIPNPIMDDIIEEVLSTNPKKKKHKVVFHAAWARGGNVAVEAVRKLGWQDSEFHAFDYLMATHAHNDSFFNMHNGVDKKTLFTHIAESEYFIYPLYTPYQDVHKDTFSCVVAEAIALGTIPVTYPLGALPENFQDYCAWLEPPPGADLEKMQKESLSKDLDGIFKYTDNIVDKINYLESNSTIKDDLVSTGKEYILGKFNSKKIGSMWNSYINQIINS
jgi:glycosyltransferase involved in cell wall biosynthesis